MVYIFGFRYPFNLCMRLDVGIGSFIRSRIASFAASRMLGGSFLKSRSNLSFRLIIVMGGMCADNQTPICLKRSSALSNEPERVSSKSASCSPIAQHKSLIALCNAAAASITSL